MPFGLCDCFAGILPSAPPSEKPPGITLTNSELEISVRQRQRSQTEFQSEMVIAAVGLNQSTREKPFGTE